MIYVNIILVIASYLIEIVCPGSVIGSNTVAILKESWIYFGVIKIVYIITTDARSPSEIEWV